MTVVVSEQVNQPVFVLVCSSRCTTDVLLPDTSRLAVRVLVREAVSSLPVEIHHLRPAVLLTRSRQQTGSLSASDWLPQQRCHYFAYLDSYDTCIRSSRNTATRADVKQEAKLSLG